jgi:TonB family protein
VKLGAKEIEIYREISCDQEVLNTSDIHPKKYASMLLELIPLNKGYGSFAVNMAVKQSTLKQRIETMKHHKMHKTSYKRSLFLLLSITLMVIAPIACSDLRGPETLSDEEILNEKITLTEFVMEINGKEVMNANEPGVSVSTQGLGAIALSPKDYGLFEFSIRPFDGAIQAGSISDNTVEFKVNQLNVSIASTQKILENNSDAMIWVRHFPNAKIAEGFSSYGDANQPPPPPPPTEAPQDTDRDIFVVVESMPELIRGQAGVQAKVKYPQAAIRAGIEGRVTVQFIVDKNGNVVDPKVIRGIGGGCDEEALRVVSQAKFKPGVQRGRNVEVQMSLPVLFRLNNSEFKQSNDSETPPPPPIKVETLESSNGTVKVKLSNTFGPLVGASVNIEGTKKGAATNLEGIAVITGLEKGTHKFIFSYVGHGQPIKEITVK